MAAAAQPAHVAAPPPARQLPPPRNPVGIDPSKILHQSEVSMIREAISPLQLRKHKSSVKLWEDWIPQMEVLTTRLPVLWHDKMTHKTVYYVWQHVRLLADMTILNFSMVTLWLLPGVY